MELIAQINGAVNGFVWGAPMLVLLIGVGILMTVRNRGLQFRKFGYAMKNTIGKIFHKTHAGEGEITPFQAVSTALAGTVGTGNIAGITTAVTLGGPGTLFWLWVTALIGMATKYSEVLLAVKFRERNKYGDWVGGPMYYIKNGLGKHWKWLGVLFCVFAALAALGTGNAIQAGNIVGSIHTAVLTFQPDFAGEQTLNLVLGIVLAVLAAIVLFGGVKRLGAVTEKLVPFMAVVYILACLAVIVYHADALPKVFHDIFVGAFTPNGVTGGAVGSVFLVISWGMKRGIFSNEAGLGTAPMAHATTSEPEPVKQALYGIFEVFMDTIVICSCTAFVMLLAPESVTAGLQGMNLLQAAMQYHLGGFGVVFIAVTLALFSFSTFIGILFYARCNVAYLFGDHWGWQTAYKLLALAMMLVGGVAAYTVVWDLGDVGIGLMTIFNMIALYPLSGEALTALQEYEKKKHLK